VINNLYGNDTLNLRKAISIKLFHAMYARLPILVCPDTYVGEVAKEHGIGFEVDEINEEMKDRLYAWYHSLDFTTLCENCEQGIQQAIDENKALEQILLKYVL